MDADKKQGKNYALICTAPFSSASSAPSAPSHRHTLAGPQTDRQDGPPPSACLARLGRAERLAKAKNYFFKEWIAEFHRLKALNEQILGTFEKGGKTKKS